MKKIPSLFCRNYDGDRLVRDEVVPGSEWVVEGHGDPTVKIDGTAVMIDHDGRMFKRYDRKRHRRMHWPLFFWNIRINRVHVFLFWYCGKRSLCVYVLRKRQLHDDGICF